jgi:hypothetical protein
MKIATSRPLILFLRHKNKNLSISGPLIFYEAQNLYLTLDIYS